MPLLCFTLTMPNRSSWDGRWSGEGTLYARIVNFRNDARGKAKAAGFVAKRSFYYRWDDGWGANILVREVTPAEARQIRKKSKGFCGYDWMITNILDHGSAYSKEEIIKQTTP